MAADFWSRGRSSLRHCTVTNEVSTRVLLAGSSCKQWRTTPESGEEAHLVSLTLPSALKGKASLLYLSLFLLNPAGGAPPTTFQTSDITSPPQSAKTDDIISPPPSRRRVQTPTASSPGNPLFSSPPTHIPTSEIDLSSPLNYGTPSSRIMGTPGGSRGTPIRPRGDIGHVRRVREVNLNPTDPPVSQEWE